MPCGLDDRCDDGIFCNGAEQCVNGLCAGGDLVRCPSDRCNLGFCDESVRACLSRPVDNDGDGFGPLECMGGDCDDSDPRVFPGARELCSDRRDNDCDLAVDCADSDCVNTDVCVPPPPRETNCTNRIDDDRDGLVDCEDPDCAMDPACFTVSTEAGQCADGVDNDGDGAVDCFDTDCFGDPFCRVVRSERGLCGDNIDNDQDGRTDCADSDCFNDPLCVMMPMCPDSDLGSATGSPVVSDSTSGRGDDFVPSCTSFNSGAPDVAYHWRAPSAGRWAFDTIGSNYDSALSVLRTCNGPVLACNDDISGGNLASQVTLPLVGGEEVIIVVDGWGESVGRYVLNINRIVTNERGLCSDMLDNDGDGAIDCADRDCTDDAACQPVCDPSESGLAACTDGLDNDCDGVADCDDSDCRSPGGSECCNGVDDNGDGTVDLLACGCDSPAECGPVQTQFGPLPGTCWQRTGTCGPDCSAFGVLAGNTICRIINPAWRCQRSTGQCVPAP